MKIILEPQHVFVELGDPRFPRARMWRGHTERGVEICALVLYIATRFDSDIAELERELAEVAPDPLASREHAAVAATLGQPAKASS